MYAMEVNSDIRGSSHTSKYDSSGAVMLLIARGADISRAVDIDTEVNSVRPEGGRDRRGREEGIE